MKIKQNRKGVFVVDGEGMNVLVDGDITTVGSPVMLTNFNFIGRPSTTVGHIKVSMSNGPGFPIRISVLDDFNYGKDNDGNRVSGDVCTVADAKELIAALEKAIQYVESV